MGRPQTLATLAHAGVTHPEQWWLEDRTLSWLTLLTSSPDHTVRCAALATVAGLARHSWARIRLAFDAASADVLPAAIQAAVSRELPLAVRCASVEVSGGVEVWR